MARMALYGENGAYAYMFGGILALVVIAYLADRLLLAVMHYALPWHESLHTHHRTA